jgi:hypothetical protein
MRTLIDRMLIHAKHSARGANRFAKVPPEPVLRLPAPPSAANWGEW